LARLGAGRLTRSAHVTYLETDRRLDEVTHELALAGVRVTRCLALPVPAEGFRPAIAFDLNPLGDGLQGIDVVEVRIERDRRSEALSRDRECEATRNADA